MGYLLSQFKEKKFPIRTFHCPALEKDYFFKRKTMHDEDVIVNEDNQALYGGKESNDYLTAIYLYFSCDKNGKREYRNFADSEALYPEIDRLHGRIPEGLTDKEMIEADRVAENFAMHFNAAFDFAWFGKEPKPEDLVSSQEGSVEQAKKPSSKAESKG